MKTKFAALVATVVLAAAITSACGSNNNGSSEENANTNAAVNSEASTNTTNTTEATDTTNSTNTTENTQASEGSTVEIKLTAKDFEYDQPEIRVKKGDHVKITLTSDDGGHGFAIPDYNVDIQGDGSGEFDAANAGTFEFHCSVMCGNGHRDMKGTLIVDEA
ncbi:cupredoxin domain-containing protein [Paenibacillus montanisoli]|uniref:Cytochrome C oxidase subunit II n=1 Tax=Paenibacillus montanisoli TaxID=2081970 RepID=A0A328TX98_9BACL|nr:cupredoxin domain-containing protein [Paenibacillus montanisoli]RAP75107.1 cytochrome C oxidase subunit II [Paenibacillus montanisoli]